MIEKIKHCLYLFYKAKFEFSNPPQKKILIFDATSISDFKYTLNKKEYHILHTRNDMIEKIYITRDIFFYFFKYFNFNLSSSYFVAMIKVIKPQIVLTTIDNSYKFHEIAKTLRFEKINFIAVQNAARYDLEENNLLFKKKLSKINLNKNFYIPQFICYGNYVEKEYRKNKVKIEKFLKFGSLRLSNYLKYIKEKKIKIRKNFYDISFVSGFSNNKDKIYNEKGIDAAWAKMCVYTIRFCLKNSLKFIFIARATKKKDKEEELKFFKKYLNQKEFLFLKKNFLFNNEKKYSSYKAIHESNVLTGVVSTMLQDKLALEGKILVCNFTNHKTWDFPIKNFCLLKKPSYQTFQERLNFILKISNKKYLNNIKNKKLIYLDKKNLTHQLIRKYLNKLMKEE